MKPDIQYKEFRTEVVVYANTPKGAGWITKHLTSNVADLHTDPAFAFEVLDSMAKAGLKVVKLNV